MPHALMPFARAGAKGRTRGAAARQAAAASAMREPAGSTA